MPCYTCITENQQSFHLTQHQVPKPDDAVRLHLAALPYDDARGPFDEELDWLRSITGGSVPLSMHPVTQCKGTWLWLEGARHTPQYLTYVVQTDTNAA